MSESPNTENDGMIPPERALEHLSVEKAWHLLNTLSSQVVGKQTELQLMVGSRYHELIESADSIVSMKEISSEVLALLQDFPHACSKVLQQVPCTSMTISTAACSSYSNDTLGKSSRSDEAERKISEVVQLMLHAPAAMWAALDSGRVLEAANLLLRCRICWEDVSTSVSVGMDSSLAAFLRSHHTYVEQFPQRIVAAGTRLLTRSRNTEETARALAALLQLQAVKEESPLRSILELLLRRRGGDIVAMLRRASKAGSGADIEVVLLSVVTRIRKTIVDVHAIFAPKSGGSCMLVDLVHPSCIKKGTLTLRESDTRRLCTTWLGVLAPKISAFSRDLLGGVADTNNLARIRGTLWKITHGAGEWASSALILRLFGRDRASDEGVWTEAASFAIDIPTLTGTSHLRESRAPPARLDLWCLLFSCIFADLAEELLKESLNCIQQGVQRRLDAILLAITGNHTAQNLKLGRPGFSVDGTQQANTLMAYDILAAADTVVSLLTSEFRSLAGDAWSLTERGDKTAADALSTSFYLLCVEMTVGLVNHLRIALQEIHACIKSAAQPDRQSRVYGGNTKELDDAMRSFADAGLTIGRVAWMLRGRSGRPLQSALKPPPCFAQRIRGRIEEQQLEAAFVIADTDGDGVVDAEEAAEALQAVSFGSSAVLIVDPSPYPSLTLSEFSLLATRLLEEQQPRKHLAACLDGLLAESLTAWSEWALRETAALLDDGCQSFADLCRCTGLTDDVWRQSHGIWEDRTIELDRDDGDGIQESIHFPVMISPAILCYIEGVAAELSRILSTVDLLEAPPADVNTASGTPSGQASKDGRSKSDGWAADGGTGQAARYARSLAAARAVNDLKQVMMNLCDGSHAPAAQACEAAQLQLLLDALFLQKWTTALEPQGSSSSMKSIVFTLCELVDPVNLQIYMPHLQAAASACCAACHTSLSLIFERTVAHGGSILSMSPNGMSGSSSTFVTLVPKARRFELLPLPLDDVRTHHSNGSSLGRTSPGHKHGGSDVGNAASVPTQASGMEAGRQALVGLMGQVGNVRSVFSASLFLGGGNRRTDVDEEALLSTVF